MRAYAGHAELLILDYLARSEGAYTRTVHDGIGRDSEGPSKYTGSQLRQLERKGFACSEGAPLWWTITDAGREELRRATSTGRKPGVPARERYQRPPPGQWVGPVGLDVLDSLAEGAMSGEELADDIGRTRVAIRKVCRTLERKGYVHGRRFEVASCQRVRWVWALTASGRVVLEQELRRGRVPGVPVASGERWAHGAW